MTIFCVFGMIKTNIIPFEVISMPSPPAAPKWEPPLFPLAALGFPALAALAFAAGAGPGAAALLWPVLGALGLFAGLVGAVVRQPPRLLKRGLPLLAMFCLGAALALGLYCLRWRTEALPAQGLEGREVLAEMEILDFPQENYGRFYYEARASVEGRSFGMLLSSAEPLFCQPGDVLCGTVRFYGFSSGGLYSARNRRLAGGMAIGGYLTGDMARSPGRARGLGGALARARNRAGRALASLLPGEPSGLIRAVLLGQRDQLEGTAAADFRQIGASHLLAVSGLHLTAAAAFLALLIRRVPGRRLGRALLAGFAVLCYLGVTGAPASAVRSFFMFALTLAGGALGFRSHPFNSLGGAVLAICLCSPFSGGDLGFALSVLSTLGLITLCRPLERWLLRPLRPWPRARRLLRPVSASLAVTLSVTAATLPLQLAEFGGLALAAPLANLLLVLPVTLLLYLSLPMALFAMLPFGAGLAKPLALCAGWLARGILWLARQLASLPLGFFRVREPVWAGLGLCVLLTLWACRRRKPLARPLALCLAGLALAGSCLVQGALWRGTVTVALAGDESSLCVLLIRDGQAAGLSLGGYNSGLAQQALNASHALRLETLLLPNTGADARAMARQLLDVRSAGALLVPRGAYRGKDLEAAGVPIYEVDGGWTYEALPGLPVQVGESWESLRFTANGRGFLVELEAGEAQYAQVLVTAQKDSRSDGEAALFLGGGEALAEGEFSPQGGLWVLGEEEVGVYLHVRPDGRVDWEAM